MNDHVVEKITRYLNWRDHFMKKWPYFVKYFRILQCKKAVHNNFPFHEMVIFSWKDQFHEVFYYINKIKSSWMHEVYFIYFVSFFTHCSSEFWLCLFSYWLYIVLLTTKGTWFNLLEQFSSRLRKYIILYIMWNYGRETIVIYEVLNQAVNL